MNEVTQCAGPYAGAGEGSLEMFSAWLRGEE